MSSAEKALIVEDETIIALSLKHQLKNIGYANVDLVITGEEAINKTKETVYQFILMDINLAGNLTGIQAAEEIRKFSDVPIIYLTSYSDKETLEKAKKTNPNAYLTKPFKPETLKSSIEVSLFNYAKRSKEEQEIKENIEKLESTTEMQQQNIDELQKTNEYLISATWREREMKQKLSQTLDELQQTKAIVEDQNKKITESINYAKRIQNSIIPDNELIREYFPDSFIFYKPKDIVSGDFPWFLPKGDDIYIAAVDCTGHGVPGAMMSLIGYFLLNQINGHTYNLSPGEVLDLLASRVRTTLNQDEDGAQSRDGMDIALCKINLPAMKMEYAGAHRHLYHVRNGDLATYKGDRKAIGGKKLKEEKFTNHNISLEQHDTIHFFSDGLPDQFGGDENTKYGPKRIREMIVQNNHIPMEESEKVFEKEFTQWKGDTKQIDDILLIGIRF